MIVSPTEPYAIRKIGELVSTYPERYGSDVYFVANERRVGIQRKEIKDLLASVNDGRLVKELLQMKYLDVRVLMIEGRVEFSNGYLMASTFGRQWDEQMFNGLLFSVMDDGVWVMHTANTTETVDRIKMFKLWMEKSKHDSLKHRPNGVQGEWGAKATDEDYAVWFLQGIPGVGVELAKRIYEKFGMMLELKVTVQDLMTVDGIGKVKAERIWQMFKPDYSEF